MQVILIFLLISCAAFAKDKNDKLQNCNFKSLEQLQSAVEKQKLNFKEAKKILTPHLLKDEENLKDWPNVCGSLLFELKLEKSQDLLNSWINCLEPREEINKEELIQLKKCVSKIIL